MFLAEVPAARVAVDLFDPERGRMLRLVERRQ
jgi:hypothetical protein